MRAILETERLLLRPPTAADIPLFVPLMGDFDVAKNLSTAPHPYTEDDGRAFIAKADHGRESGEDYGFAILGKGSNTYLGTCGVHPAREWEIGYWIGKPYWGQGYATEAAGRLVAFAFDELLAEQLTAGWFYDNPASGRVLAKLGFVPDGWSERSCLSRGTNVFCHKVLLRRTDHEQRKQSK